MTQRILEEAKQRLHEVEDGIATMQAKYRECIAKKEELELKCEQCEQRLGRADKVRTSLGRARGHSLPPWAGGASAVEGVVLGWLSLPSPWLPWSGGLHQAGTSRASLPEPTPRAVSAAHQRAVRRAGALAGDSGEPGAHA